MASRKSRRATKDTDPPASTETPSSATATDLLDRGQFIDSDALADYLKVPLSTLDQWASRGGGPAFHKVGKFRRYHPTDVRQWLAGRRHVVGAA